MSDTRAHRKDLAEKIRLHLRKAKASTLMIAHAQSPLDRQKYLKLMSDEMKRAVALVDRLEQS
jgi:hypothetical protein